MARIALFLLSIVVALPAAAACPSLSFFKGKKYSGSGEVITPDGTVLFVTYSQTFAMTVTTAGVPSVVTLHASGLDPSEPIVFDVIPVSFDRATCRSVVNQSDGVVGVANFYDNGKSFSYVGTGENGGPTVRTTAHLQ